MKLALPTSDKITISKDLGASGYFKIITFCGNDIIGEEFRRSPLKTDDEGRPLSVREADSIVTLLADCDTLICSSTGSRGSQSRISNFINTVTSRNNLITSAAIDYNRQVLREASNSCCCP